MYLRPHALLLLPLCIITAILADFLGPTYPAPIDLSSNKSLVAASWKNLTSVFDAYLKGNQSSTNTSTSEALSGVELVTFSAGLFSIHDPAASKLQYHYTSPEIANATQGTTLVDGDSIYRTASVSKLFTVFAGLLELTDEDWNRPLTDVIPGLADFESARSGPNGTAAAAAEDDEDEPVYRIQWDKITPWALASQLAGVPTLGVPTYDLLYQYVASILLGLNATNPETEYGLPPVNISELGPCWDSKYVTAGVLVCPADEFVLAERSQPPTFLPWTTPAYSDDGFMLLGIAISKIRGKSIATIYRESIFEPLGMTSSNSSVASDKAKLARSVIAGDFAFYSIDSGFTIPSGGIFSTINDLAKFGIAILNSTLFPTTPELTRKWMKPISHTASLSYSVGAPWEIIRYIHPDTGKVTDLYTKLGDSGNYGGCLVLIPDYNAGFSLLETSSNPALRSVVGTLLLDYITEAILPALEAQAAAEAVRNYVGEYVSTDPAKLNSSVTVVYLNANESSSTGPGLAISSWISNGTDVLAARFQQGIKPRLLPTIISPPPAAAADNKKKLVKNVRRKVAFQLSKNPQTNTYTAVAASELGAGKIGPFSGEYVTNFDWLTVDQTHYGGIGLQLFVFDLDDDAQGGYATALSPAVTRAKLQRKK